MASLNVTATSVVRFDWFNNRHYKQMATLVPWKGRKSWLCMAHSVTVTQQRASVLSHMCTEAATFISAQALGGQCSPRRNKYSRRPVGDTRVPTPRVKARRADGDRKANVRTAKAARQLGQVSATWRFAAYHSGDAMRGSAHRRGTSRRASSRSFRRGVTHTQSGSGRGSRHVFENIGALWLC